MPIMFGLFGLFVVLLLIVVYLKRDSVKNITETTSDNTVYTGTEFDEVVAALKQQIEVAEGLKEKLIELKSTVQNTEGVEGFDAGYLADYNNTLDTLIQGINGLNNTMVTKQNLPQGTWQDPETGLYDLTEVTEKHNQLQEWINSAKGFIQDGGGHFGYTVYDDVMMTSPGGDYHVQVSHTATPELAQVYNDIPEGATSYERLAFAVDWCNGEPRCHGFSTDDSYRPVVFYRDLDADGVTYSDTDQYGRPGNSFVKKTADPLIPKVSNTEWFNGGWVSSVGDCGEEFQVAFTSCADDPLCDKLVKDWDNCWYRLSMDSSKGPYKSSMGVKNGPYFKRNNIHSEPICGVTDSEARNACGADWMCEMIGQRQDGCWDKLKTSSTPLGMLYPNIFQKYGKIFVSGGSTTPYTRQI